MFSGRRLDQTAAGGIHRKRVATHDQGPQGPRCAVERTVSFHADDAIHDRQVRRPCQGDVHDTFVDAAPVQLILGPAVANARKGAEQVLQRQRGSGPMMRLSLGSEMSTSAVATVRLRYKYSSPVSRPRLRSRTGSS